MIIGKCELKVYLAECQSLKDKRSVIQSVLKRTSNKFNAAIGEVADQELWQRSTIGIAVVGNTTVHVEQQLQTIVSFIEREPRLEVTELNTEII